MLSLRLNFFIFHRAINYVSGDSYLAMLTSSSVFVLLLLLLLCIIFNGLVEIFLHEI